MLRESRQILGVRFYTGDTTAITRRVAAGGLTVVPSAPVLVELARCSVHREAIEGSDMALLDSGFLVLLWMIIKGERLPRMSGLRFMRALVEMPEFQEQGATFWIMPTIEDARANCRWLQRNGIGVTLDDCHVAPMYPRGQIVDEELLAILKERRPRFVVINLGGGVQERLGFYLRKHLGNQTAIICTGAAIAFLSGRQANIPPWADRLMLGWLMRCLNSPTKFVPRYWDAFRLVNLILRHGHRSVAAEATPPAAPAAHA